MPAGISSESLDAGVERFAECICRILWANLFNFFGHNAIH